MFKKKVIFFIVLTFLVTSCGDSWKSVKRGLTGNKANMSTDEFLVKKKDPLILPPNFDSLPSPSEREEAIEEISSFERTLKKTSQTEITSSSTASSTENSILKQIRKQ